MQERRGDYPQILIEINIIKEKIDKVCKFIDGNGSLGAKVRLDRLEQIEKSRSITWNLVLYAVIGLIIREVIPFFMGRS